MQKFLDLPCVGLQTDRKLLRPFPAPQAGQALFSMWHGCCPCGWIGRPFRCPDNCARTGSIGNCTHGHGPLLMLQALAEPEKRQDKEDDDDCSDDIDDAVHGIASYAGVEGLNRAQRDSLHSILTVGFSAPTLRAPARIASSGSRRYATATTSATIWPPAFTPRRLQPNLSSTRSRKCHMPTSSPSALSGAAASRIFSPDGQLARKQDCRASRYREMIAYLGDRDPTTHRMLKEILASEEGHAEDLFPPSSKV